MDTTETLLERAAALLRLVTDASTLDDTHLIGRIELVESAGRLVDSLRVSAAAELAERSRFELGADGLSSRLGQRRPSHLLEQLARVSSAEALRRMRVGAMVRSRTALDGAHLPPLYPAVSAGLESGAIGFESAALITRYLEQVSARCPVEQLATAELQLVEAAMLESTDLVAGHARLLRDALDPDGAEPREEELRAQASIRLGRERNGMTPIVGLADPVGAARLRALFDLAHRRRRHNRGEAASQDSDADHLEPGTPRFEAHDAPGHDPRTIGRRNYDALIGAITAGVDAHHRAPRSNTTVVATIRLDDLHSGRGVGYLDGVDEPVSARTVQELACDADIRVLSIGRHGEVLSLGRRARLFSYAQRVALAARDGGCIWPNCTAPPEWCDAHHVVPYGGGTHGRTDVDNGVLLCPAHHHALHASDITLRMVHGTPRLEPPPRLAGSGRAWRAGRSRISKRMLA